MRVLSICGALVATLVLAPAAGAAGSASMLDISGAGDGHGIGMSQYGAYGYALHGRDYRFILSHYYQGTALARTDPKQTVRVLIGTGSAAFSGARGVGKRKLDPGTTYEVRALPDGTLVLFDQVKNKKIGHYYSPLTIGRVGPLNVAGHGSYRGALEFRAVGSAVRTVDVVGLDDYVRGVVSAEMPSGWAPEALKAQAVAARTYAITSNVAGDGYQLYPDTRSQMYAGVAAETPATDAAVAATRGQIVTYDGAPATTFFSSSSGGHTENIENVWVGSSPEPWLRGVTDPYDGVAGNPYHRWSHQLTIADATAKLGSLVKGQFVGIEVTKQGVSPRIVTAEVIGSAGKTSVTGTQLQRAFGLPSTYMMFTTISTSSSGGPGLAPAATHLAVRHARLAAAETGFTVLVPAPRTLDGSIFPAPRGALAEVQLSTRRGWRTAARVHLGAAGSYSVRLRRGGSYRVLYHYVAGPPVQVR